MPHCIYLILRWLPGILGLLLRQKLYRHLLGRCGRRVLIGRFVDFHNPQGIILGDNVILNDCSRLDAGEFSGRRTSIILENGVFVGAETILAAGPGKLTVGEGSNIGSRCRIFARGDIHLGHHSLLAGYCTIGPGQSPSPATTGDQQISTAAEISAPTIIGQGCWLGLRSHVCPGARIGEGAIVGAHAVVDGSIPAFAIAIGRPARVERMRP